MQAGVARLAGYSEPFSLLLGDIVHRRFRVPELADQYEKYLDLVSSRNSSQLRVFERIVRHDVRISPTDLDSLSGEEDRITSAALYCQQVPLPPDYAGALHSASQASAYELTHTLLALIWLEENGCRSPADAEFDALVVSKVAELLADDGPIGDLEIEASALLVHWGAADELPPSLLERLVDAQLPDGGFSYAPAGRTSNWHTTALALWLIGGVLHPNGYAPSVIQGPR